MPYSFETNSYLKTLKTEVKSCTPVRKDDGTIILYKTILWDSILFPGGSGQFRDKGSIDGNPVLGMQWNDDGTVGYFIESPVIVGQDVEVLLDWDTRLEHMQQHSAKFLLSAAIDKILDHQMLSWTMGQDESYIELDTPHFSLVKIAQIEGIINDVIRDSVPLRIKFYDVGHPALPKLFKVLKVPKFHVGPVRVVSIQKLDYTASFGTYVSNTSHIQAIKLLYAESLQDRTKLYFLSGVRLLRYLGQSVRRQRKICHILHCLPDEQLATIKSLKKSLGQTHKDLQSAVCDLGRLEGKLFNRLETLPKYYSVHKKNASVEFIDAFLSVAVCRSTLFFLTVDGLESGFYFVLSGLKQRVELLGPIVCDILRAEGSLSLQNTRFDGKGGNSSSLDVAEMFLKSIADRYL